MITKLKNLFKHPITIGVLLIVGIIIGILIKNNNVKNQPQYQTAQVERGTLVVSLAESGQVAVANRVSVTTQASGAVAQVNVKNGDTVTVGETIATVTLDLAGQQRQTQAWAQYLSSKTSLENANAQMYALQSTMFSAWQAYTAVAENSTFQNPDGSANVSNRTLPQFTTLQDNWLAAEAQYKNQQNVIAQAQASVNNNWISYQLASGTITAPVAGVVNDLILAPGMQIGTANTTGSATNNNTTSQVIASITNSGNPVVNVSLSEIDATQIKAGDKVTVTFDALPDKTFSGKVIGINTTGSVSSGVTTYPAVIMLDAPNTTILPNMSATANIITNIKDDVLLVPSAAVTTTNGQSTVRVMKQGQVTTVPVEIGLKSDTQTEIKSGLSEGDTVVTAVINQAPASSGATSSPFGAGFGGNRGFGGGTFIRTGGGGGR